jgi:dTMP kinase
VSKGRKGRFIVIEGVEGSGKTTSMTAVAEALTEAGKRVHLTREPGGTPLAEEIRKLVLHWENEPICANSELLLMFAARAQHLEQVILPRLRQGDWVVCDRFTDSSYAYQGMGRGLGDEAVAQMEQFVQGEMHPDLVVLMDIPVLQGQSRNAQQILPDMDRIESEHEDFHQKVRECYLRRAAADPDRYVVIDANQPREQVRQCILDSVHQTIKKFGDN